MNEPAARRNQKPAGQEPRLFTAIEPPEHLKCKLARLATAWPGGRRVPPGDLHLTLRFIGPTSRPGALIIQKALAGVQARSFVLELNGLGLFTRKTQAVLWAGLAPSPLLRILKAEVDRVLTDLAGLKLKKSRFAPHITLSRFKNPPPAVFRNLAAAGNEEAAGFFPVCSFTLFQSRLTPQGAVYSPLAVYKLKP